MDNKEVRHMKSLEEENDLVSAMEYTGAAPRAMDETAAQTIAEMTEGRCSPSFTAEDPIHSGENVPAPGCKPKRKPCGHKKKGQQPLS